MAICGVSYRNPEGPGIVTCCLEVHDEGVAHEQVERLMAEAGEAGDAEQVRLCERALTWFTSRPISRSGECLRACVRAIRAAEAMVEVAP